MPAVYDEALILVSTSPTHLRPARKLAAPSAGEGALVVRHRRTAPRWLPCCGSCCTTQLVQMSTIRDQFRLLSDCHSGGLDDEATTVTNMVDAALGRSRRRGWMARAARLGWSGRWSVLHRASASRTQKAAARGRSALAPLRAPPRARCMARRLCLGASRAGQRRQAAAHSEGGRPALAAESLRRRSPETVEMSSDGAEAHRAASGRCGGFA